MTYSIKEQGKFRYLQEGEGEVVVLLHGLFGSMGNYTAIMKDLKKDYQLLVPMLPIYDTPKRSLSILSLMEHVQEFLQHLGHKRVHLVGNSLGGHIALLLTLQAPELVQSLTLTGSSGLFENALGSSFPRRQNYDFVRKVVENTFYDPIVATKEIVDEVFEIINTPEKGLKIIITAKSAMRHNLEKELHRITAPTLLIWGKEDNITPAFVGEDFQEKIANSTLHFFENCGHAPMMEYPQAFIDLLRPFFEENTLLDK
ncbi:MAG: alpha/beta fold hydrolase [Aureispira sp.]